MLTRRLDLVKLGQKKSVKLNWSKWLSKTKKEK